MKSRLLVVAAMTLAVPAFADVTVVVGPPTFKSGLGNQPASSLEDCLAKAQANAAASPPLRKRTEHCDFPIVTTVTSTPPPPECTVPQPPPETRPGTCPAGTSGTWSQTRTYEVAAYPTCWTAGAWTPTEPPAGACVADPPPPPPPPPPPNGVNFTDLASAPACARVVQYPAKTVVAAADAGVNIHQGNCYEVAAGESASSITAKFKALKPGDDLCFHAGTFSGVYGEGTWYGSAQFETYKKGTAAQPISVRSCPGEVAELKPSGTRPSIILGDGSRNSDHAEYLVFAGFKITASAQCISGGGDSTDPNGGPNETGGRYIRVAANACTITDANSNTMTGLLDFGGDGWKILGNAFRDPANRVIINNNHGIYAQGGADDFEIGWNDIRIHGGAQIQVHQDGAPKLMERGLIHDNVISATNYGDGRGISVINIDNASTITIRGDRIFHQGQGDWGCLALYRGVIVVDGLDCTDTQGPPIGLNGGYGGTRKVTITNSRLCSNTTSARVAAEGGASLSQATETSPRACP